MTAMRDEVARAIYKAKPPGLQIPENMRPTPTWDELHPLSQEMICREADAAIAVMERYTAERTVPSDEELLALYKAGYDDAEIWGDITEMQEGRRLAGIAAVRIALGHTGVVPGEFPEWVNYIEIHMGSIHQYEESFGKWHCVIRGTKDHTGSFRMRDSGGYLDTWQAALAAACAQATGEGVSE